MSACKFAGHDQPRFLPGRHDDACDGGCDGCLACPEPHCRVCGYTHTDGTCAECLGATREDLHAIAARCGALPAEVVHRGVESEAMTLLGPSADPEAWGHLTASVKVGRLPADYLADGRGELHPLFVLGTWEMGWRAELEHDEADVVTIRGAVDYLDRQMTYMAGYAHAPFEDFARDLRRCLAHLDAVLHDGEQRELSRVPCIECGRRLERRFGSVVAEDHHYCVPCRRPYNAAEFAIARADWLASEDAERYVVLSEAVAAVERPEFTVRTWIRRGVVGAVCDIRTHRLMVWWPDVRQQHAARRAADQKRAAV